MNWLKKDSFPGGPSWRATFIAVGIWTIIHILFPGFHPNGFISVCMYVGSAFVIDGLMGRKPGETTFSEQEPSEGKKEERLPVDESVSKEGPETQTPDQQDKEADDLDALESAAEPLEPAEPEPKAAESDFMKEMPFLRRCLKSCKLGALIGAGGGVIFAIICRSPSFGIFLVFVGCSALVGAIEGFAWTRPERNKIMATVLMPCVVILSAIPILRTFFSLLVYMASETPKVIPVYVIVLFSSILGIMALSIQIGYLFEKPKPVLTEEKP